MISSVSCNGGYIFIHCLTGESVCFCSQFQGGLRKGVEGGRANTRMCYCTELRSVQLIILSHGTPLHKLLDPASHLVRRLAGRKALQRCASMDTKGSCCREHLDSW